LRLKGLGKEGKEGERGDLFLFSWMFT